MFAIFSVPNRGSGGGINKTAWRYLLWKRRSSNPKTFFEETERTASKEKDETLGHFHAYATLSNFTSALGSGGSGGLQSKTGFTGAMQLPPGSRGDSNHSWKSETFCSNSATRGNRGARWGKICVPYETTRISDSERWNLTDFILTGKEMNRAVWNKIKIFVGNNTTSYRGGETSSFSQTKKVLYLLNTHSKHLAGTKERNPGKLYGFLLITVLSKLKSNQCSLSALFASYNHIG